MARSDQSHRSTLRSVLDQLGALVLGHDAEPDQLERTVTGVVIDDPGHGAPLSAGCAVLAVGTHDDRQLAELLTRAGAADAAAVIVQGSADDGPLPPPTASVPVVSVAPDLAWEQLHLFVRTALLQVGAGRPGEPQTLFDVANALAVLVDGAIVIEDEHLRVLAYSSLDHPIDDARRATIIGRAIPEEYVTLIREAGITAHLEGSGEPVRYDLPGPDLLPRLAIALRSGERTIGVLWAITDDEREAEARRVLADSAPDVAVELLRHLTADVSLATDRLTAAQQLLDGRPVANLRDLLGVDAADGYAVLSLEPLAVGGAVDMEQVPRTAQFAAVYVDAYRIPALASPTGGRVDMVLVLSGPTDATRARQLLDELCGRIEATFGFGVRGAMGAVVEDVRGVPGSRHDAAAVLEVLADGASGGSTASYDEVQSRVALRELLRSVDGTEHLRRGPVPALLASTATQDMALVVTMRTFLESGGDIGRTAATLAVHRNTVRYRVSRFAAVTGLDLADPTARLIVQVQLTRS